MKKLPIICSIIFAVGMLSAGNAFAVGYCKDVNPPTKDFQETLTLSEGDTVTIDIYINDIRTGDHLISGGFLSMYSPSIEIVSVTVDGAWDGMMTVIDTSTPGVLFVGVGQLSGVAGDGGNDVRIAALEIHCLNFGVDQITFMPDPAIDMIVSTDDSHVYDPDITPNIFTLNQVRCCDTAADCDDDLYCNGQVEYCDTDTSGLCGGYVGMCYRDTNDPCAFCDIYDCTCDEDMDFCVCEADNDCDSICNPGESAPHCTGSDNCPTISNINQEDTLPPGGNNCGDACECEGDFEPDGDVDGTDAFELKDGFWRKDCSTNPPCNGDFECDGDVDGTDAFKFKVDFWRKDCPSCGGWPCVY